MHLDSVQHSQLPYLYEKCIFLLIRLNGYIMAGRNPPDYSFCPDPIPGKNQSAAQFGEFSPVLPVACFYPLPPPRIIMERDVCESTIGSVCAGLATFCV